MPRQQRASATANNLPAAPKRRRRKVEYLAAVRFQDGEHHLYAVSNAVDAEDARRMVLDELENVASVMIAV